MEQDELTTVYRVNKTLLEMLRDRNFKISENELKQTFEQFREKYNGESANIEFFSNLF
jgi:hypothetical protein